MAREDQVGIVRSDEFAPLADEAAEPDRQDDMSDRVGQFHHPVGDAGVGMILETRVPEALHPFIGGERPGRDREIDDVDLVFPGE